jgi:hypothetical protein
MLIALSKFIYGPLKAELGLFSSKRPRRYTNETYLLFYAEQLWTRDWYVYQKSGTRVGVLKRSFNEEKRRVEMILVPVGIAICLLLPF